MGEEVRLATAGPAVADVTDGPRSPGVWTLVGLGSAVVGALVLGLVVGLAVDGWLDTSPALTLVGLAVGLGMGLLLAYVRVRGFLKRN